VCVCVCVCDKVEGGGRAYVVDSSRVSDSLGEEAVAEPCSVGSDAAVSSA